jgi:hypothetical protein
MSNQENSKRLYRVNYQEPGVGQGVLYVAALDVGWACGAALGWLRQHGENQNLEVVSIELQQAPFIIAAI